MGWSYQGLVCDPYAPLEDVFKVACVSLCSGVADQWVEATQQV